MDRNLICEMTNMCLIQNSKGEILFQKRTKKDWPGYTLPGGHVEKNENLVDSVKREIYEETGLKIINPTLKGVFEYKTKPNQDMYLVFMYFVNKYEGIVKDSLEGHLSWMRIKDVPKEELAEDMDLILKLILDDNITDISYIKDNNGNYKIVES